MRGIDVEANKTGVERVKWAQWDMLEGKENGGWQSGPLSSLFKFPGETMGTTLMEDRMSILIYWPWETWIYSLSLYIKKIRFFTTLFSGLSTVFAKEKVPSRCWVHGAGNKMLKNRTLKTKLLLPPREKYENLFTCFSAKCKPRNYFGPWPLWLDSLVETH